MLRLTIFQGAHMSAWKTVRDGESQVIQKKKSDDDGAKVGFTAASGSGKYNGAEPFISCFTSTAVHPLHLQSSIKRKKPILHRILTTPIMFKHSIYHSFVN